MKTIIYVEGGLVQAVYSTDPENLVLMQNDDLVRNQGVWPPVPREDMGILAEKATENCRAEIKAGKFFKVY